MLFANRVEEPLSRELLVESLSFALAGQTPEPAPKEFEQLIGWDMSMSDQGEKDMGILWYYHGNQRIFQQEGLSATQAEIRVDAGEIAVLSTPHPFLLVSPTLWEVWQQAVYAYENPCELRAQKFPLSWLCMNPGFVTSVWAVQRRFVSLLHSQLCSG